MITATYSPEDDKIRLYPSRKLDDDDYQRVKGAGFSWAPKQECFYAVWQVAREDLAIELSGEIIDEDTSLVERAEQRASRFEDYSASRLQDAHQAKAAVDRIADGIPMGQPILIGHHSEKHARKDADRIENGMRKAVKMWETAQYWTDRAHGAIRAAKYKERPDVRARRIKGLEAEDRKVTKEITRYRFVMKFWAGELGKKGGGTIPVCRESALWFCNMYDHTSKHFTLAEYPRTRPDQSTYEGIQSLYFALKDELIDFEQAREISNLVHSHGIERETRYLDHIKNRLAYERAMLEAAGGIVADRTKPDKGGACRCWASPGHGDGWSYIQKVNKVSVTVLDNWGNGGRNFTRTIPFDNLKGVMTAGQVQEARAAGTLREASDGTGFYLFANEPETQDDTHELPPRVEGVNEIEAMKDTLRAGVQVVSAPDLFPTPSEIVDRMIELSDLEIGQRVLEPSAGTGNIINRLRDMGCFEVEGVEINAKLAGALGVRCCDFLECNGNLGKFDRIIMNPPFSGGADVRHINHARGMLAPGGRIVALCANGPRQQDAFRDVADLWEELPAGSFKSEGTGVNVALVVISN